MKISLDQGRTWRDHESIQIEFQSSFLDNDNGNLLMNVSDEGIILEYVYNGSVYTTMSHTQEELYNMLV
jgi:hypothetical protein